MKMLQVKIFSVVLMLLGMFSIQAQDTDVDDLINLSLEELMSMEITSVSKKAERLQDVASAVYLITADDIQRSGATRLADILQMNVPGLFFDFNNYNEVDFGVRTITEGFQGSVLVLVDNVPYQSQYTSAFDFANFDFDLDEIDRIEVIRGPGGTIYGANAATGVINIFTKQDESGWRTTIKQGSRGFLAPSVRYATDVSENTNIKVFAKGNFFDGFKPLDEFNGVTVNVPITDIDPTTGAGLGTSSGNTIIVNELDEDIYRTNKIMGGFNVNSQLNKDAKLSAHVYLFNHQHKGYFPSPSNTVSFLFDEARNNSRVVSSARLDQSFNENHSLFVQLSNNRETLDGEIGIRTTSTANLEVQDNYSTGIHNFSTGLNLRSVGFRMGPLDSLSGTRYTEEDVTEYLWGIFAQDRLRFGESFDLTLGIKAETWTLIDNKPELSPSLRFSYRPSGSFTLWGAASRSVTTPGFIQTNLELTAVEAAPPALPLDIALINSENINQSEYLTGELGIKTSGNSFALDVSGFYAQADELIGTSSVGSTPVPSTIDPTQLILPITYSNTRKSNNYGVETIIKYFPSSQFRFELSHSWFKSELEGKNDPFTGEKIVIAPTEAPGIPEHIVRFKSYLTFGENFEVSINSIYNTKSGGRNRFFYDQQRNASLGVSGDLGVSLEGAPEAHFRMDFKMEKFFSNRKASIFIWANDVFNDGTLLNYNSFQTGIPMQVHRLVGAGASVKF